MFGWLFKRKTKAAAPPAKSEKPPPTHAEIMRAKRLRAKARRRQRKAA